MDRRVAVGRESRCDEFVLAKSAWCCLREFHGLSLSVLIEEFVPYTMNTFVNRLHTEEPSVGVLHLLTGLCAATFSPVFSTAVALKVRVPEGLHWG